MDRKRENIKTYQQTASQYATELQEQLPPERPLLWIDIRDAFIAGYEFRNNPSETNLPIPQSKL